METSSYDYGTAMTRADGYGDTPLPKRNGPKSMVPLSWVGREIGIDFVNGHGNDVTSTRGTLLDWCVLGLVLSIKGTKTLVSFDRLVLLELVND